MLIRKYYKYVANFLAWFLLTVLYFHIGQTIPINSDGVANILEAQSIINGNTILHGWTLPSDTFYTLDTQIDVLFLLLGVHLTTIYHLTPAVIYSSLVMLTFYIIKNISKSNYIALISVIIFLAFPVSLYKSLVLFSPIHVLTTLLVVLVFYMYHRDNIKHNYIYSFILLYISIVGDPYAVFIGTVPIICFSLVMLFRDKRNNNKKNMIFTSPYIRIITSSIAATVLAKTTVYIIGMAGGYHVVKNQMRFITMDKLSHNIYLFFQSILVVMQSDFFGRDILSYQTIVDLIHAALLSITFIFMAIYLTKTKWRHYDKTIIANLSIFSILITSFSFVFSTEPINIETSRYLLDIPVFIAILFGYLLTSMKSRNTYIFSSLAVIAIFVNFLETSAGNPPASNENYIQVIKFLKNNNLDYGLAGYWNAAPFTLLSDGNIKVRQVLVNASGDIAPFAWLSNRDWYKEVKHPQFVIIGKSGNFGLTSLVVANNFGKQKQTKVIGDYKIIVYK